MCILENITVGAPLLGLYHSREREKRERETSVFNALLTGGGLVAHTKRGVLILQQLSRVVLLLVTRDELDA